MSTAETLKVVIEGTVTSFRYPHFTHGYQPTYEMPPLSTIYGLICSAVGDLIDHREIRVGYHFAHSGKFVDYCEHLHFNDPVQPFPFDRELLFQPRLTLYIDSPYLEELKSAFVRPHYMAVLGRSQDLVSYRSIRIVSLQRSERAYFQGTLLPLPVAPFLNTSVITVTMPRFISHRRVTTWKTYTMLQNRALWPPDPLALSEYDDGISLLVEPPPKLDFWVDPETPDHPQIPGLKRGVFFLQFEGKDWDHDEVA